MLHNSSFRLLFICLLLLHILGGCGYQIEKRDSQIFENILRQTEKQLAEGDYVAAAENYIQLSQQVPENAVAYRIKAAQAFVQAKYLSRAQLLLDALEGAEMLPSLVLQKDLLRARISLTNGDPLFAIELLSVHLGDQKDATILSELYLLRAQAFLQRQNYLASIQDRMKATAYLNDPIAIQDNYFALWEAFSYVRRPQLQELLSYADEALRGWAELAMIDKTLGYDAIGFEKAILKWLENYPQHPALENIVPKLTLRTQQISKKPGQVALLLPFEHYPDASNAIRDGFLAAWYEESGTKPKIRIYSTDQQNILKVYQMAVADGAEFIVGPLEKETIATLLDSTELSVSTLLLNEHKGVLPKREKVDSFDIVPLLIQFSLAPESEALQITERAWFDSHARAIVITPNSQWGDRIDYALSTYWKMFGGTVLAQLRIDENTEEIATKVKDVLHVNSSEQRINELRGFLQRDIKAMSRHRQDIDAVFIAVAPEVAGLIIPQFNYYQADYLPFYSTSNIHKEYSNTDFDRVRFVDIPWLLDIQHKFSPLWDMLNRHYHAANNTFRRLYAFGVDAYRVMLNHARITTDINNPYIGETGFLTINQSGIVQRKLIWGKFENGKPRLLDTDG